MLWYYPIFQEQIDHIHINSALCVASPTKHHGPLEAPLLSTCFDQVFSARPGSASFRMRRTRSRPDNIKRSFSCVATLEPRTSDGRPGFQVLDLLNISEKCINFFVTQIVVADDEEHLHDSACESIIDICWLYQGVAAVESQRVVQFHQIDFISVFHWRP